MAFFANQASNSMAKNIEVQHAKQYVKLYWDSFHKVDIEKAFDWLKKERGKNQNSCESKMCVVGAGGTGRTSTITQFVMNRLVEG